MSDGDEIRAVFPEIDDIEDDELRDGVISAWTETIDETGADVETCPWYPPDQTRLDLSPVTLVDHVRDVVLGSAALAEIIAARRPVTPSMDTVVAGALVHDVSKLYEFDGMNDTEIERLLGHPRYGIHVAARAGLPPEILHIVVSHSPRTSVEPATIEAEIVSRADAVVATAIRAEAVEDLRDL